jgi:hypothetical protein
MPDTDNDPKQDPAARGGNANPQNREMAQQVPPGTPPAAEWGERADTGKAIAHGGKESSQSDRE